MRIASFKDCIWYIKSDAFRYTGQKTFLSFVRLYLTTISFRYIFWMRICCFLGSFKYLFIPFAIARIRLFHISHNTGIQIPVRTDIDAGFYIGHYGTIIINGSASIGKNVNLSPDVCIGQSNRGQNAGVPKIGDNVYIGPGAKIFGRIVIGNNVSIGANAVVNQDIPDSACVVGNPATIISMNGTAGYVENRV